MPILNTIKDDAFARANAGPGSGANSSLIGNGWRDYVGNFWQIFTNALKAVSAGTNPPKNALYDIDNSFRDGAVMAWGSGSEIACVSRFNPASGGSGYCAMLFNNTWFFYKLVAGNASALGPTPGIGGTAPTNAALKMTVIGDGTTSQITAEVFDQSDLNTVLFTKTITDSTVGLQGAGNWGVAAYNNVTYSRIQISKVDPTLTAGSLTTNYIGKTVATVISAPPTGGNGTLTYQWQRAIGAGSYTNISGATGLTFSQTGLTPNTLYYCRLVTTDSLGVSVTSAAVPILTFDVGIIIGGFVGDSITFGLRVDVAPPVTMMAALAAARSDRYSPYCVNVGIAGSKAQDWLNSYYASTIATLKAGEVNRVFLMFGTNEADASVSAASYGTSMAALIAKYLTPGTGVNSVRLNEPFYNAQSTLISQYPAQLDALENGTTILHGDRTSQAFFAAHTDQLQVDGVHPLQVGANSLAGLWSAAELADIPPAIPSLSAVLAGNTLVLLKWIANVDGTTGYELDLVGTTLDVHNTTAYLDANLTNGTARAYRIRAYNAAANRSAWSAAQTITPNDPALGGGGDEESMFTPLGSHTTVQPQGVLTLTRPATATALKVQCLSPETNVRYTLDGSDPSATHGFVLFRNTMITLQTPDAAVVKIFSASSLIELNYQWGK